MNANLNIRSWCKIDADGFQSPSTSQSFSADTKSWKQLYKWLGLNYSKIFKMDSLCKWSFLAVELLKKTHDFKTCPGIYFANHSSSYDADAAHLNALHHKEGISPAVFVYTLPNIAIGEIAIANQWHASSQCEIFPLMDPRYFFEELQYFIQANGNLKEFIFIWCEVKNVQPDVFAFHLVREGGVMPFNVEQLVKLYQGSDEK